MKKLILLIVSGVLLVAVAQSSAQDPKPASRGDKPATAKSVRNVGVEEFDKLRFTPNTVVLDVRTPKEYDASHIKGAVNIDFNASDFQEKIKKLDPSKTYLVHCAGGVRSAKACNALDKIAFTNLVNLDPGFRAWEKAGKPIEKK